MRDCKHEWYVFSLASQARSLLVECRKCKRYGTVVNPTKQELKYASATLPEQYLWEDNLRVVLWPGGK
jgi:hypothetical protein